MKKYLAIAFFLLLIIGAISRGKEKTSPSADETFQMPQYQVLDEVRLINGSLYADVLIPGYSKDTDQEVLKKAALTLAKEKGYDEISLYSTEDAKKANFSSSFLEKHPDALVQGYLGSYKKGKFIPSSYH